MNLLPKAIYRFNAIPIKLTAAFFIELEQKFYNLYGNTEDLKSQAILRKKNGAGIIKAMLQARVIKTVWYWHKNRNIDQ